MSTISKERVKDILEFGAGRIISPITDYEIMELARIALASLEAEPIYQLVNDDWYDTDKDTYNVVAGSGARGRIVYAAPPEQVSVPDLKELEAILDWILMLPCPTPKATQMAKRLAVVIDDCRSAMLQGAGDEHIRYESNAGGSLWIQCSKQKYERMKAAGMLTRVLYERPQNQQQNIPENIPTLREAVDTIRSSGIEIDAEKIFAERDALNAPDCWCRTCRPVTVTDMRFVVCPDCGNKRCPHANDHRNACTGSNEPGQEGSAYPAEPQQEVK